MTTTFHMMRALNDKIQNCLLMLGNFPMNLLKMTPKLKKVLQYCTIDFAGAFCFFENYSLTQLFMSQTKTNILNIAEGKNDCEFNWTVVYSTQMLSSTLFVSSYSTVNSEQFKEIRVEKPFYVTEKEHAQRLLILEQLTCCKITVQLLPDNSCHYFMQTFTQRVLQLLCIIVISSSALLIEIYGH